MPVPGGVPGMPEALNVKGGHCNNNVRTFTSPPSQWVFLRRRLLRSPGSQNVSSRSSGLPEWTGICIKLVSPVSSSFGLDFPAAPEEAGLRRDWLCAWRKQVVYLECP